MAKPIPTQREIAFSFDEMFFSRTDDRGIILSGNDVFVRISGYERSHLMGNPHNVVRHPDMPKAVFRLFWETIKAGRPVSAYVKNLAADGSYYWVLATVFPIEGGYLSIRIKPSTPLFRAVPELYKAVAEKEKQGGIEAALAHLLELLKAQSFPNYEAFMTAAIVQEIRARSLALADSDRATNRAARIGGEGFAAQLGAFSALCSDGTEKSSVIFSKLEHFGKANEAVDAKSAFILRSLQRLDLLSVNMSTAARRLGSSGTTLVAVSAGIQKSAYEFKGQLVQFQECAKRVSAAIARSQFQISTSQLQIEMIDFYLKELLRKLSMHEVVDLAELASNAPMLLGLSGGSVSRLNEELNGLKQALAQIRIDAEGLRSTVNSLEIIRKTGEIEAAQIAEGVQEFGTYFKTMVELIRETGRHLAEFQHILDQSLDAIGEIAPSLHGMSDTLGHAQELCGGLAKASEAVAAT